MSVLSDIEIIDLCDTQKMINPYISHNVKQVDGQGVLSYGVSAYGYDVRLGEEFKLFSNAQGTLIDPKRLDEDCLVTPPLRTDEFGCKYVILPPNSYLLGVTLEYFQIPDDIIVVAVGKSTLARAGISVNVTPVEPGFKGNVVIEISNLTTLPIKVYANEGIAQFLFFQGNQPCQTSYADKNGKYQGQTGVTLGKV